MASRIIGWAMQKLPWSGPFPRKRHLESGPPSAAKGGGKRDRAPAKGCTPVGAGHSVADARREGSRS